MIVGKQVFYPNKKLGLIKHFIYNVLGFLRPDSAENIKNALHAPPVSLSCAHTHTYIYCKILNISANFAS